MITPSPATTIAAAAEDAPGCLCGNQPHLSGFVACNSDRDEAEPTPELWDRSLYLHCSCGLVFDVETFDAIARTLLVVGFALLPDPAAARVD